jgi:hypothetical protein
MSILQGVYERGWTMLASCSSTCGTETVSVPLLAAGSREQCKKVSSLVWGKVFWNRNTVCVPLAHTPLRSLVKIAPCLGSELLLHVQSSLRTSAMLLLSNRNSKGRIELERAVCKQHRF